MKPLYKKLIASITALLLLACLLLVLGDRDTSNTQEDKSAKVTIADRQARALDYLTTQQAADGSFLMDFCQTARDCEAIESPFMGSFILTALQDVQTDDDVSTALRSRLSDRLQAQAEIHNDSPVWRFWPQESPNHLLLPPDIDDTACIGASLKQQNSEFSAGLAKLSELITTDGFKTYIITQPSDNQLIKSNDIDCVVNANALFYYALFGEQPEEICVSLNRTLQSESLADCSIYYADNLGLLFAASRAYRHGATCLESSVVSMKQHVLSAREPDGTWGNDLSNALAALALQNLGVSGSELDELMGHVQSMQQDDGSWNAEVFFADPVSQAGFKSKVLTTALSAQALARYKSVSK